MSHAELHFAPSEKNVSGVKVEQSLASMAWDTKYDKELVGVYDDTNVLDYTTITAKSEMFSKS